VRCQKLDRPPLDAARVAELYSKVHHHQAWRDHRLRVPLTATVANDMIHEYAYEVVADLSCGDGAMLRDVFTDVTKIYGDLVPNPAHPLDYVGSIESTIHEVPRLDLLICAETLEHVTKPGKFLAVVRGKTDGLVLSTPIGSWDDPTPGHYWAWDREYVEQLLTSSGFTIATYAQLEFLNPDLPHDFGIWGCV
jgi:hypothetical protein